MNTHNYQTGIVEDIWKFGNGVGIFYMSVHVMVVSDLKTMEKRDIDHVENEGQVGPGGR